MKKLVAVTVLCLFVAISANSPTHAQYDDYERYYQERRQLEDAELDARQNEADISEYELESKIAAVEEREEREQLEADEENKQLLVYVILGLGGATLLFFLSSLWKN